MIEREVTIWKLEMRSVSELRPARPPREPVELLHVRRAAPELARFFYTAVGGDWFWTDRLGWTLAQWEAWMDRPEIEFWQALVEGAPAGFYVLEVQGSDVEIAYFGMLPAFTGRGLGGHLLTQATARAWELATRRVWLHTCSLDHPGAKRNYEARGYREFAQVRERRTLDEQPPGPWPGAV